MEHLNVENIYREIALLSDADRDKLYTRIQSNFYKDTEIVAYTTDGDALTRKQYKQRLNAGIEQCRRKESVSLEKLSQELGYEYANL
jgi:hypothetical protein